MKILLFFLGVIFFFAVLFVLIVVSLIQGWWTVAGVCAAVVLVFGLLLLWAKRKIVKFLEGLKAGLDAQVPDRITLTPVAKVDWPDQEAARKMFADLQTAGFKPISCYAIGEMEGTELIAFVHPRENSYAVIYNHPRIGSWMDMVCRYEDGGSLTVSTEGRAGLMDKPEGHVSLPLPGASVAEVFARFKDERRPAPLRPATAELFKEHFESAYAEEMDWRKARGGATAEEVQRVADHAGMDVTPEQIEQARDAHNASFLNPDLDED